MSIDEDVIQGQMSAGSLVCPEMYGASFLPVTYTYFPHHSPGLGFSFIRVSSESYGKTGQLGITGVVGKTGRTREEKTMGFAG